MGYPGVRPVFGKNANQFPFCSIVMSHRDCASMLHMQCPDKNFLIAFVMEHPIWDGKFFAVSPSVGYIDSNASSIGKVSRPNGDEWFVQGKEPGFNEMGRGMGVGAEEPSRQNDKERAGCDGQRLGKLTGRLGHEVDEDSTQDMKALADAPERTAGPRSGFTPSLRLRDGKCQECWRSGGVRRLR